MRNIWEELTFRKVLFGLVILVTLATSAWSMASLVMTFGAPKIVAIPIVMAFDVAGLYFGLTAMDYAVTDDSGFFDKAITWLIILLSIYINGYHGWIVAHIYGLVLGAPPAITGLLFHSYLRKRNLEALRAKGRLAKAMPHYPLLHWMMYPVRTSKDFRKIVGFRRDALTTRAINEEKEYYVVGTVGKESDVVGNLERKLSDKHSDVGKFNSKLSDRNEVVGKESDVVGKPNSVQQVVRESLTDSIRLDEMMEIVGKQFPTATRKQVSSSMSTERKRGK